MAKRVTPVAMVPEEAALLQAIADAPEDDTARLVFADWLQENGQGNRAWFVRRQIEAYRDKYAGKFVDVVSEGSTTWFRSVAGSVDNPKTLDRLVLFGPWDDMLKEDHRGLKPGMEPGPRLGSCLCVQWCGDMQRRERINRSTYWVRGFPYLARAVTLWEAVQFAFTQANANAPDLAQESSNGEALGYPSLRLQDYRTTASSEIETMVIQQTICRSYVFITYVTSDAVGVPSELEQWLKYDAVSVRDHIPTHYGWRDQYGAERALNYAIRMVLKRGGELYRKMVMEGRHNPQVSAWNEYKRLAIIEHEQR